MVIGLPDRGKTTFTTMAVNALAEEALSVAVVDTDIGQSEIGPPGTVGVALMRSDVTKLTDLKPLATFFVGSFSPNNASLELLTATVQAVHLAQTRSPDRIVVDTTGFVTGALARRLKVMKAQAVRPHRVLALGYPGEIEHLSQTMASACGAQVVPLPVPETVGRKTPSYRVTRRMTRLATAFGDCQESMVELHAIATLGATLGTGEAITPELVRWCAETLRISLVRGEMSEGVLNLFATTLPKNFSPEARMGAITTHFSVRSLRLIDLNLYHGVLVGLQGDESRLLGMGRFLEYQAARNAVILAAPTGIRPERIRLLTFGRVRLKADMTLESEVRPGEL